MPASIQTPTPDEIRHWLEGNICRCTGYHNIVKAVESGLQAIEDRRFGAGRRMTGRNASCPRTTGIGASVKRVEDYRFLTGRGRYTDDMNRPGQCHAYIVRSATRPCPHTVNRHQRHLWPRPGFLTVLTGADMVADNIGSLPCGWA